MGMGKENPLLVLASGDDPQFAMLNHLPHTVCGEVAACAQAGKDATVILQWSGTRELLRGSACDLRESSLGMVMVAVGAPLTRNRSSLPSLS